MPMWKWWPQFFNDTVTRSHFLPSTKKTNFDRFHRNKKGGNCWKVRKEGCPNWDLLCNCSNWRLFELMFVQTIMEQHALKIVNNRLNTNIYSYLETSGFQSSNPYLIVVHFLTPELIRNLWQLKTAVFLHWCLIRAVPLKCYYWHLL